MDLFEELRWRGLIHQISNEEKLRSELSQKSITFYCGFDPTAPSLHHGNLVQLILMRHLQLRGHHPIALIGGGTGLIGDPRQSGERVMNTPETVQKYVENIIPIFSKILDFQGENPAKLVNNYEWLGKLSAIEFLRDIGKYFRMSSMLAKDTVQTRLNSESGLSFTEFSYQALQAYDYYQLFKQYGANLQTGGSDQWGNLTAGIDLIHKKESAEVFVLTTPLITKSDGTKFGKSEGGAIWLDPKMMSPYAFYQFWLNTADSDAIRFLKVFTFLSPQEIDNLEKSLTQDPGKREAQKALAANVTTLVHGETALQGAIAASLAIFGGADFNLLDIQTLDSIAPEISGETGVIKAEIGDFVLDKFVGSKLVGSKNEARRALNEGGLYINNERLESADETIAKKHLLQNKYVFLRRGKKKIAILEVS